MYLSTERLIVHKNRKKKIIQTKENKRNSQFDSVLIILCICIVCTVYCYSCIAILLLLINCTGSLRTVIYQAHMYEYLDVKYVLPKYILKSWVSLNDIWQFSDV